MDNIDKVKASFSKQGFNGAAKIRKPEFQQFLNSLMKGEPFDLQVAEELWEQSANGKQQITVDDLCTTIVQAQNIVQGRLFDIRNQIKQLQDERKSLADNPNKEVIRQIQSSIDQMNQQKIDFQEDLRLLTEPFGINILAFMAKGEMSLKKAGANSYKGQFYKNIDEKGNEIELKMLFYLTLLFGIIQIIVIYKKYDFLNLIVLTCLLLIFLMNQFDSTYMKSTLVLMIISQILDMIWIFMDASEFWNPPARGTESSYEKGYLKLIVLLTFLGLFLKIPLGVFVYHYRNTQQNRVYDLDVGVVKFSLTPHKKNPITEGINNFSIA